MDPAAKARYCACLRARTQRPMMCSTTYCRNIYDQYLHRKWVVSHAENVPSQLGNKTVVVWPWAGFNYYG
jgi:hypothetical protein